MRSLGFGDPYRRRLASVYLLLSLLTAALPGCGTSSLGTIRISEVENAVGAAQKLEYVAINLALWPVYEHSREPDRRNPDLYPVCPERWATLSSVPPVDIVYVRGVMPEGNALRLEYQRPLVGEHLRKWRELPFNEMQRLRSIDGRTVLEIDLKLEGGRFKSSVGGNMIGMGSDRRRLNSVWLVWSDTAGRNGMRRVSMPASNSGGPASWFGSSDTIVIDLDQIIAERSDSATDA